MLPFIHLKNDFLNTLLNVFTAFPKAVLNLAQDAPVSDQDLPFRECSHILHSSRGCQASSLRPLAIRHR